MNRQQRIERKAAEILAKALNRDEWQTVLYVARAQAEEELGPPPYELNRVCLNVNAQMNGVPVEDL